MKKYRCYGVVTGSKYLGVIEAENPEEAKRKALESGEAYVFLCYQCAEECNDPDINEVFVEEVGEGEEE